MGCPLECSYCFLPGFLDTSFPVLLVNFDDLEKEMDEFALKGVAARIGTGEMTDSLVFEPLSGLARHLISLFAKWPHLTLELKTKTTLVDNILDAAIPNVVVAWSLNPPEIAAVEEPCAPLPRERLLAAQKCYEAGYRVGLHFDPILQYPEWESLYSRFIQEMFDLVPVSQIAWISLGTFRIFPQLRDLMRRHFPQSQALFSEILPGYDGKLRYFRADRIEIYRKMCGWLQKLSGGQPPPVYLCMESQEVWNSVDVPGTESPSRQYKG
jgi:spore photoproduct lyase